MIGQKCYLIDIIGIILLFENAVSLVQSRRYEDLSSVLKQIKRKAEMELLRRNNQPRLLRIYATNIESVLYAGIEAPYHLNQY